MIDYLDIQLPNEQNKALWFNGRTTGCGCCSTSYDFSYTSKAEALALADQWIAELKERLTLARKVKADIKSVKVADWDKARSE
jgi:hypothetical protein